MYKKDDLLSKIGLLLNEKPYLTFEKICSEIGIARATAYKFFSDKEDLVFQITDFYLSELNKEINGIFLDANLSLDQKVKEIIEYKVDNLSKYKFLKNFLFVFNNKDILEKYNNIYYIIGSLMGELKSEGKINDGVDIKWSLYSLDGFIQAGYYSFLDGSFSIGEIKKNIINNFYLLNIKD